MEKATEIMERRLLPLEDGQDNAFKLSSGNSIKCHLRKENERMKKTTVNSTSSILSYVSGVVNQLKLNIQTNNKYNRDNSREINKIEIESAYQGHSWIEPPSIWELDC